MQLLALDSSFQPVSYLPYFNLQWNREYYAIGQYSVQIAAADYDPAMAYLYTPDRPETGIIQKVELTETIKGRFVQLSGFFLEALLNDKVVYPTYYASGTIPAAVVAMLRQYKDDIPLLTVADAPAGQADETSWQETGGQLADVAYTRLRTVQHSLRCRYDYQANTITAEIWQGLDRTQEQAANPFVTFSDGFGNLAQVDASMDRSNYKNYAVVVGQDQAENRKVAYADLSGGGYKRVLYVDARSERWDSEKQTEAEYLASLQQKGLDALLDSLKMLPFLYLAYWLIEAVERSHGARIERILAQGGKWGFLAGGVLGCLPQCGFSAMAANLYASRVIQPGYPDGGVCGHLRRGGAHAAVSTRQGRYDFSADPD